MTATDAELLVVGGGPVGLVAALEARARGLDVVVVEQRTGPIDKACGEGLMPGALPMLGRLGVAPHGMALRGIRYADGRRSVEHRFSGRVGLGVRRTTLQAEVESRAVDAGVRIVRERVDAVRVLPESVEAAGIRARWLIGADGLHSAVARRVGLARPAARTRRRFGIRRHYRIEPWTDVVEVHWTPVGEVYATPVEDRLVGIAALLRPGAGFADALAAAPELAARLDGAAEGSESRGAGPFRQRPSGVVRGRVLLVGDASGYLDAVTGEGLRIGFAQAGAAVSRIASGSVAAYADDHRRLDRGARRLTAALALAATTPARRLVVPAAAALPRVFAAAVDALGA